MKWVDGDLIEVAYRESAAATTLAFTANSVIKNNGALVMGGGAAKRVRDFFPHIDEKLGKIVSSLSKKEDFYLIETKVDDLIIDTVLAVQVKRHFKDDGDLELTKKSLKALAAWCKENPEELVVMNCPLIGLGGFADRATEIKKIVSDILGDANVIVCVKD